MFLQKLNLERFESDPVFCFTSDVDWASDACIKNCHNLFLNHGIKPTYFVTHPSEFLLDVDKLRQANFGSHPNFLKNSDHGGSYKQVVEYFNQFPNHWTKCFRSHRFYDVTDINAELLNAGYLYDSNLFKFLQPCEPYVHFSGLIRIPSCWEDGTHLNIFGLDNSTYLYKYLKTPGLKVIGVHPLHMALNSPSIQFNRDLKTRLTSKEMISMDDSALVKTKNPRLGIRNLFEDILDFVASHGYEVLTLEDVYKISITGK